MSYTGATGGASNGRTTNISGLAELNELLQTLPAKIEANVLRAALRAGQKPILDAARENINDRTGALSKSLRIKTQNKKGAISATLVAGSKKAYYAHMVEFGTAQHFIKPKNRKSLFFAGLARAVVDHPGAAASPFMRPAWDASQTAALEAFRAYVASRLPKELQKAGLA